MNWEGKAMISRISLADKSIFRLNIKRYWFLGAFYLLALLLISPLAILTTDLAGYMASFRPENVGNILHNDYLSAALCYLVPVLSAVAVFRYMQNGRSATLLHSLPYSRPQLFVSNWLSGFVLYAAPIVVTGLVLLALKMTPFGVMFGVADVFIWMGMSLFVSTVVYSFSVFVGMFTGSTIAQLVFIGIVDALPVVLCALFNTLLDGWLYGYTDVVLNQVMDALLRFLPINPTFDWLGGQMALSRVTAGVVYIVGFTAAAFAAYRRRHIETSGDVVAFRWVRPVFVFGVAFCALLVGSVYVGAVTHTGPNLLVMLLWGLVGYAVARMLVAKSFRIWGYYKEYLAFALAVVVLFLGVQFDLVGFSSRVPDPQRVTGVYVGHNPYAYLRTYDRYVLSAPEVQADRIDYSMSQDGFYVTQPDNVRHVTQLHEMLAERGPQLNSEYDAYNRYFVYQLANGRRMVREFCFSDEEAAEYLAPVLESTEYKDFCYPLIRNNADRIKYIDVRADRVKLSKNVLISTPEDISSLVEAMCADVEAANYAQFTSTVLDSDIRLVVANTFMDYEPDGTQTQRTGEVDFRLLPGFTHTQSWLREHGCYNALRIMPHEVQAIELERLEDRQISGAARQEDDAVQTGEPLRLEQPALIETVLGLQDEFVNYHGGDAGYVAVAVVPKGSQEALPVGYVREGLLPAEVQEQLSDE